ncbi:glycoside hydrolase family 79 protein [Serpula lacrymans var. lacrymans S7.3]|uniref:Glycoside hydrolase family 79 protein n=2 Tax=Serpula lacrymans var. lacrymans TaxID=341189 RepID=F8PYP0_SERL3|nr:glycoside hydrolase family 79 protein [Serpula lacrymans var. lacrymans S7.9]EGN99003.1 glycoside hydrolase family 79 protein [Serpula lacrymans var. lacrymans S7.3]EGO24587.1 glycoside hydrolase family 79 protein [Serpula lacrymans var. lacrymans S7.9]
MLRMVPSSRSLYPVFILAPLLASALNVSIPLAALSTVPAVAPELISLSIEQDRWVDWAGTSAPNVFFYNALDNMVQITGEPPWIRIGADSEDHTIFSPGVEYEEDIFPPSTAITPYPEATNISAGYAFYEIISHLPAGTHVHWGVNLGQYNITAAYLETKAMIEAFNTPAVKQAGITLDFIEVGNEADLYISNGARNSSWDPTEYISQWSTFAANVSDAAGLSPTSYTKFIGGAFAGSSHNVTWFSPQAIFFGGILNSEPGSLIRTISQHDYSGSFCTGSGAVLQQLMTKSYIRGNISVFIPDISATHAQGLDYIIGEGNSMSCHGAPGVSNTAGAALWVLDYSFFASQVGISRLHFHEGIGYKYNFIQPVTLNYSILDGSPITPLPPHIQPPYYAAIIAAEAIGSSGDTKAIEIAVNNANITGYAFYENGALSRALFINLLAYLPGDSVRTSTHLDLNLGGYGVSPETMSLKRLEIGYANDTSGLTWGGQTYETSDARVSGQEVLQYIPVSAGIDIQETEVVLVQFL